MPAPVTAAPLAGLQPIEQAWSKLRHRLRGLGARTTEALEAALAQVIDALTAADAQGCFQHCGYARSD